MKVLTIANYIYNDEVKEFRRNNTGYGHMVNDIVFGLSKKNDVDVLLFSGSREEFIHDDVRFLDNRIATRLRGNFFSITLKIIRMLFTEKLTREHVRFYYSFYLANYLGDIIKGYDAIHLHGCSPNLVRLLECIAARRKVVVTLHGLNSFNPKNKSDRLTRCAERRALLMKSNNIKFTVLTPRAKQLVHTLNPNADVQVITNFLMRLRGA